jgi:HNH endonuclease
MTNYTPRVDRFWAKVDLSTVDIEFACIHWVGAHSEQGYGHMRWEGKHLTKATRIAYEIAFGEFQKDLCVLHHCDNPKCVNPNHLFLGSRGDNNRDREQKGRGNQRKREKHGRHKLTEEQVAYIREKYARGGITYKQLGTEFGLHYSTIGYIITGKHWR